MLDIKGIGIASHQGRTQDDPPSSPPNSLPCVGLASIGRSRVYGVTEPDIAALVFLLVMCQAEYTPTMGNPEGQCECKGRAVVPLLLSRSNCRCQENRRRGRSLHWSIWTMMVLGLLILSIGRASASDLGE